MAHEATDVLSSVTIGKATATDLVGVVSLANDAPSTFPVGTTIVTWTASDNAGNSASGTQKVIVVDTTAPVLTIPANIVAHEATDVLSSVVIGTATATDIAGVTEITNDAPDAFPLGITIVTWTAWDKAGNNTSAEQWVTVVDTTAPVIINPLPAAFTPRDMPVSFSAVVSDIFSIADISISGVDCYKYTKKGKRVSKLDACVQEVDGSTLTISEAGGVDTIITWTVTATDSNNNVTVESFTIVTVNPGKKKK